MIDKLGLAKFLVFRSATCHILARQDRRRLDATGTLHPACIEPPCALPRDRFSRFFTTGA